MFVATILCSLQSMEYRVNDSRPHRLHVKRVNCNCKSFEIVYTIIGKPEYFFLASWLI